LHAEGGIRRSRNVDRRRLIGDLHGFQIQLAYIEFGRGAIDGHRGSANQPIESAGI
jgi:hypothetical protein